MTIRRSFYFWVALLLCLPLAYFVIDRVRFEVVSVETSGTITAVTGRNDRCGTKRRRHNCTKFKATIRYEVRGAEHLVSVSAGKVRGHDQPTSRSDYRVGQRERVVYDPGKPANAYRNTFWDIWGAPAAVFFFQICAFIGSLRDKRQRGLA